MSEIERAISEIKHSGLYGNQVHQETMELALQALQDIQTIIDYEEKLKKKYGFEVSVLDVCTKFVEYLVAEEKDIKCFRVLTNEDKENYDNWKQEKVEREKGIDLTVSGIIDSEGRCRNRNCNICDKLREEKADMDNGCDICNNHKPLLNLYTEYSIEVDGREMSVWQGLKCEEIFKINHCPNCGRKLVEE